MKPATIRYIAQKFAESGRRRRFLNFARAIAVLSVMLGSMALIISLAVLGGFDSLLRSNAVKFTSHITIRAFNRAPLMNYPKTMNIMKSEFPEVKSVAPVIEQEGLIRFKSSVEGIVMRGILPEYDITGIKKDIVTGRFGFSSGYAAELIIGERLADRLGAKLGDSIVIYSIQGETPGLIPQTDIEKFRITGIYHSGMAQYDDILVYMPYIKAARFFNMPEGSASMYEVMLKNPNDALRVGRQIENRLGYPYFSMTVFELHAGIFAWIDLQKKPIPLVLALISIVAVLNIVTTLLITVVEKTHSIGVLRALGMKNKDILSIFVMQGITIGLLGTLAGSGIGFIFCWLQKTFQLIRLEGNIYFLDRLPIEIEVWHYAVVIGMSLLLSLLATLIPSLVAVRVTPLRAIRYK